MATGTSSRTIRAPGSLIVNPTDLSSAFPFGGVEVGKTKACVLQSFVTPQRIDSEGLGDTADILEGPQIWVFSCFLRGWDDDALQTFFSKQYALGTGSSHGVIQIPGNVTPGESALSRGIVVLYVPDNLVAAPAVLIHKGIPDWSDGAEMAWQRQEELGIPLAIECVRSSSNRILTIGRIPDLVIS